MDAVERFLINPENVLLLIVFAMLVALGHAVLRRYFRSRPTSASQNLQEPVFLSPGEELLFRRLEEAAGKEMRVFPKVSSSVLPRSSGEPGRTGTMDQFVHFLLCREDDLAILGVVEAQGPGGIHPHRESYLKGIRGAGIPVLILPEVPPPSLDTVRGALSSLKVLSPLQEIDRYEGWRLGGEDVDSLDSGGSRPSPADREEGAARQERCSVCGAEMFRKQAIRGKNAGRPYLVCSRYPQCSRVLPLPSRS